MFWLIKRLENGKCFSRRRKVGSIGWKKMANEKRLYFRVINTIWNPNYPFIGGRLGEYGISGAWMSLCSKI